MDLQGPTSRVQNQGPKSNPKFMLTIGAIYDIYYRLMVKDNLNSISKRVKLAAKRAGRDAEAVKLVCVTKGIDPYRINKALVSGVTDIGENRVQEAISKKPEVMPGAKWHLIGHLQTNKVKDAIANFDFIHSVDSLKLAHKINKEAKALDRTVEVMIQVNTSGEEAKYGITPEEVDAFLAEATALKNLQIVGLMTITPLSEDPEKVRPHMKKLKEIFDRIKTEVTFPNVDMEYLSMGMSQDFEVAVEEGANLLRIGTAVFKEKS